MFGVCRPICSVNRFRFPCVTEMNNTPPKAFRLTRDYSRFIYCGVSVGEMSGVFGQVGKVDELVCFEPDPNQFD